MTRLANPFRIIAHRGASGYAPENTMAAFERAVAMGATEVETDVAFTRDGKLLLFHDFTLERTTNGKGLPEDYTLAELKQLDAGSWRDPRLSWDRDYGGEKLIALEELLDRFGSSLTYHVTGQVFFASSNSLVDAIDYQNVPAHVRIDVSGAHFWDVSAIGALDDIVHKLRRHGARVEVAGLNEASASMVDRFAKHHLPKAARKGGA